MEDDLVASLTRQVKEEVIENYVLERRLIELQIEHLNRRADEGRALAWVAGKRLARLSYLMIEPGIREDLKKMLGIVDAQFWSSCLTEKFRDKVRFIPVRALTRRAKFRKLVIESYSRLKHWMQRYRSAFDDLCIECEAVNSNIVTFQRNFDLLAILNFLRNLDMQSLERKKILGDNFTAKEMAELDKNLYIRPISLENLSIPLPLDIPEARLVESRLLAICEQIYRKYEKEVQGILR